MSTSFSKHDLSFLATAIEKKAAAKAPHLRGGPEIAGRAPDKVAGEMSIPKPVEVNVNGTMSASDYKACSMVMAVCQNMVQKSIINAAKAAAIEPAVALKSLNAWVQGYVDFPFPFFNFKDTQSDVYVKNDFMLSVDTDVVDKIVNIKGLDGLKQAVIDALQKSGGNLASYQGTDRKFNYFGVVTGYNETEISTRVIKFQMNLKTTNVDSLCVHYAKTNLDTAYDTYQFVADKEMMIKMQAKMGEQLIDYMANKLLEFVKSYYDNALDDYQHAIANLLKKKAA